MAWPWIAGNRGGGAVSSQGFGNRGGACSIENLDCGFAVQLVNVAAVPWWILFGVRGLKDSGTVAAVLSMIQAVNGGGVALYRALFYGKI